MLEVCFEYTFETAATIAYRFLKFWENNVLLGFRLLIRYIQLSTMLLIVSRPKSSERLDGNLESAKMVLY